MAASYSVNNSSAKIIDDVEEEPKKSCCKKLMSLCHRSKSNIKTVVDDVDLNSKHFIKILVVGPGKDKIK
jgi:hypothetical protein